MLPLDSFLLQMQSYRTPFFDQNLWRFYFPKTKLFVSAIPKNATTNILASLMTREDCINNIRELTPDDLHEKSYMFLIKSYACCFTAQHKLLVLRDPVKRVISSFLDRFVIKTNTLSAIRTSEEISKFFPQIQSHLDVTFSQFVRHVADYPNCYLDPHWRPQIDFVAPVQYTKIITLENRDSLERFLSSVGCPTIDRKEHNTTSYHRVPMAGAAYVSVRELKAIANNANTLPDDHSLTPTFIQESLQSRFADDYNLLAAVQQSELVGPPARPI